MDEVYRFRCDIKTYFLLCKFADIDCLRFSTFPPQLKQMSPLYGSFLSWGEDTTNGDGVGLSGGACVCVREKRWDGDCVSDDEEGKAQIFLLNLRALLSTEDKNNVLCSGACFRNPDYFLFCTDRLPGNKWNEHWSYAISPNSVITNHQVGSSKKWEHREKPILSRPATTLALFSFRNGDSVWFRIFVGPHFSSVCLWLFPTCFGKILYLFSVPFLGLTWFNWSNT